MTAQEKAELILSSLPAVNLSAEKLRQLNNVTYTLDQAGYLGNELSLLDYYRVVCMVLSGGYKEEFRL